MEFRDYLHIALRNWVIVIAAAVIGIGVGAVVRHGSTSTYASHSEVFVSTAPVSTATAYANGLFAQQRATAYADMVKGGTIAAKVVQKLKLPESPTTIASEITTSLVPSSGLIKVTVTDTSASRAQQINQAAIDELQKEVARIETSKDPTATKHVVQLTIISPATLPTAAASKSRLPDLALGLLGGLLVGVAAALLREQLNKSVRDLSTVPHLVGVPVLGSVPATRDAGRRPLIADLPNHAPRAEALRLVATNLHFAAARSGHRAVVVSSALEHDGKSLTATNVALAAAAAGTRVVLVDANLRRPRVDELLGVDGSTGLTSVLVGERTLSDVMQVHGASGLSVLTAGPLPADPAAILQSAAMQQLLADLRARADLVIIDTPPLLAAADAVAVAGHADAALLVVDQAAASRSQLSTAVQRLQAVGTPLLGIVLNKTARLRGGARYAADRSRSTAVRGGARRSSVG